MQTLQFILIAVVVASCASSVFYSVRHRRTASPKKKGVFAARMNISMGTMMLAIALIQIALFEPSTVRVIVGVVFLLIGLFNLFAGVRNHSIFSRMEER
jgi:hypothetical protein